MMGTTTPIRGLYKPARGEVDWDVQVNSNFDNLDATANTSYVDSSSAATLASANAYTNNAVSGISSPVTSVNGKVGAVVLTEADIGNLVSDLAAKAPLASPVFTGTPVGPTLTAGNNSTGLATTAFVQAAIGAITFPVTSVAGKTGAVTLVEGDIQGLSADLAAKAPLASPALTGTPTSPTAATTDNSTAIATTAFVKAALGGITGGFPSWATIGRDELAPDANLLTVASPAAGVYLILYVASQSSTSQVNIGWGLSWTDLNGNAEAPSPINISQIGVAGWNLGGAVAGPRVLCSFAVIDTNGSAPIVVKTTGGSGFAYKASAVVIKIA